MHNRQKNNEIFKTNNVKSKILKNISFELRFSYKMYEIYIGALSSPKDEIEDAC